MTKAPATYTEAINELEKILKELEQHTDVSMDIIAEKVKYATVLIDFCKNKLHQLDKELEKMIAEVGD